jgi:CubicO group peptidase (beta-lactamase class C family)
MTRPNNRVTRRGALARLAGVGGLAVATQVGALPGVSPVQAQQPQQPPRPYDTAIPIQGKAGPGLEPFDAAMLQVMDRHGVPGAAIAVARGGKLLLAKGYGWADVGTGEPVQPDTHFGLCSLSKTVTAVATLVLVEQGKLGLDDHVFGILKDIRPPRGAQVDPRLANITVRQCLNHSGGWDREVRGDPINWEPQICRAFKLRPPLSAEQFISFLLTVPLDFAPGTDSKYSNNGFIILGEVIARVSGQPYARFVGENVLKPMGVTRMGLNAFDGKYQDGEARRHLAGTLVVLPPPLLPMVNAAGGWSGSVVDLARFLTNLDGSRGKPVLSEQSRKLMMEPPREPLKRRENGTYFGLGWDSVLTTDKTFAYFKDGSYQGMRSFMKRLPSGINWALVYNASMDLDSVDLQIGATAVAEIRQLVERFEKYPDVDLFKEFP